MPGRGLVLREVIRDVGRGHQFERHVDLLLDGLATGEFERGNDRTLALTCGVLEHGHVHIARRHRGKRIGRGINSADQRD